MIALHFTNLQGLLIYKEPFTVGVGHYDPWLADPKNLDWALASLASRLVGPLELPLLHVLSPSAFPASGSSLLVLLVPTVLFFGVFLFTLCIRQLYQPLHLSCVSVILRTKFWILLDTLEATGCLENSWVTVETKWFFESFLCIRYSWLSNLLLRSLWVF